MQASALAGKVVCFAESIRSSYDNIAGLYDAFWADWYFPAALPALERLFFDVVPSGSRVLDVCCGSGHVATEFAKRGYLVTGVDQSSELIQAASKHLPKLRFHVQDVRQLRLAERFQAAYSTFDSLNHLLSLPDLCQTMLSVRSALLPNAPFVFDMNLEEAYFADSRAWTAMVAESNVGLVRGLYDREQKLANTELIWFKKTSRKNLWAQQRSVVQERCYSRNEIFQTLNDAGFQQIEAAWAIDLGVTADLGYGRMFFSARA